MITRRRFLAIGALASLLFGRARLPKVRVQTSKFNFVDEKGQSNTISGFIKNDRQFISLNELAPFLCLPESGDRFLYVEKKQKLVVVKNKQRIIFSSDNTFVKFNDQLIQIYIPTVNVDDVIYIDAKEFAQVMSEFSSVQMQFNEQKNELSVVAKGFNITGISFESRKNGVIARLVTTKEFPLSHIQTSIKDVNNKLYITVLNGQLNVKGIEVTNPNPFVTKVQAIQSENSALIVLTVVGKLSQNMVNVAQDDGTFDLMFTIGTKLNQTQQKIVEEKRKEEDTKEKLDRDHDKFMIDTIVIDAGHGGKDPGAVGKLGSKPLYEKTVVLDIAQKIKKAIKAKSPNVDVVLTRTRDEFVTLRNRGKIANKNRGKLFISLHCNANRSSKANGFETYVVGSNKDEKATAIALAENKVIDLYEGEDSKHHFSSLNLIKASMLQRAYVKHSFYLAEIIDEKVGVHMKSLKVKNRGVKQAPFYVLYGPSMPSILIEIGFISNKREVKILGGKTDRSKIAKSIAWAILDYKRDIDSTV